MTKRKKRKKSFGWGLIILMLFSTIYGLARQEKKPILAVLDLEGEGVNESEAKIITDFVEEAVFNTGRYELVSRTQIEKIMAEMQFQQSGMSSIEGAVNIGRFLAAKRVVIGTVGLLGNTFTIQVKLVNVESGRIENIQSIRAQAAVGEMPDYIGDLIDGLLAEEIPGTSRIGTLEYYEKRDESNLVDEGIEAYNKGYYEHCFKIMEEILASDPDNATALEYIDLAEIALAPERISDMVYQYIQALKNDELSIFYEETCSSQLFEELKRDAEMILASYSDLQAIASEIRLKFQGKNNGEVSFSHVITGVSRRDGSRQVIFEGILKWDLEKKGRIWKIAGVHSQNTD